MDFIFLLIGIISWVYVYIARKQGNREGERLASIVRNISFLLVILLWSFYVIRKYRVDAIEKAKAQGAFYREMEYNKQKTYDHVISNYNKAIERNPNYAQAYVMRGAFYVEKGNYGQAISDLSKAIELNPNDVGAYLERAHAYYFNQEYSKAWEDVHKTEELGVVKLDKEFIGSLKKASGRED